MGNHDIGIVNDDYLRLPQHGESQRRHGTLNGFELLELAGTVDAETDDFLDLTHPALGCLEVDSIEVASLGE